MLSISKRLITLLLFVFLSLSRMPLFFVPFALGTLTFGALGGVDIFHKDAVSTLKFNPHYSEDVLAETTRILTDRSGGRVGQKNVREILKTG